MGLHSVKTQLQTFLLKKVNNPIELQEKENRDKHVCPEKASAFSGG
jgi:hypothetical protein